MEVTIGGQRLGSGNKRTEELHNYNRATFNQEQDWKSSMAPGVLYPFLCIPMTNGDSMDIDLDSFVRTLPTKGPLFGSFKLQCDIFSVPMRLYNGILHNNPIDIGLKMKDIYFPKLLLEYTTSAKRVEGNSNRYTWQVHPTSLLKYLGLSGVGMPKNANTAVIRKINAVPVLAYYDIFKNYYANKQEENAYVIGPKNLSQRATIDNIKVYNDEFEPSTIIPISAFDVERWTWTINGKNLEPSIIDVQIYTREPEGADFDNTLQEATDNDLIDLIESTSTKIKFKVRNSTGEAYSGIYIEASNQVGDYVTADIGLLPFKLQNIDDMRNSLLGSTTLGDEYIIGNGQSWDSTNGEDGTGLPYSTLINTVKIPGNPPTLLYTNYNSFPMNGLMVKTYQSDLFNNWIKTDWIEGENGIAALSAVDVSEGSFAIDALNIAEKVYNMLNRIALSGGTYEDWQEAVYTQDSVRKAETPIYEGGMSTEIVFEEVISSAETQVEDDIAALGTLGGKGTIVRGSDGMPIIKGGRNIHIKAREPIFVMGIVSLTPRICYTQGNEWYLTDLNSYDDLHKPALDQIGFQDLIVEQMAWWDSKANGVVPGEEDPYTFSRNSAGKVVAWSNYMTAVDKAFGDFAMPEGKGFMVLARNYTYTNDHEVGDITTYIDPAKFNYAFAYNDLKAQNFWTQIHSKVITRRVMSAHQIPNL